MSISGSFLVEVNTTNHRVEASVVVGGRLVTLDLARARRAACRRDGRDDQRARPDDLGRCLVRARHDGRRRRHRRQRRRRDRRPRGRRQPQPVARWRTRHRQRRHGRPVRHQRRRRPVHAGRPTERHGRRQHPRCSVRGRPRPGDQHRHRADRRDVHRRHHARHTVGARRQLPRDLRSNVVLEVAGQRISGSFAVRQSTAPTERGSCGSPSTTARSPSVGPRRSSRSQTSTATSS